MTPSAPLRVLVLLSTGKQGSAVVSQLSTISTSSNGPSFEVLAVTRNSESDAAKKLAALPNVSVLQGNTSTNDATEKLFTEAGSLHGLVLIQLDADGQPGGYQGEIEEAKRIIDIAKQHRVNHITYHGMDLPPNIKLPTEHDYVKPKLDIPDYLAKASDDGKAYTWTVQRPCNFFENLIIPGYTGFMITLLTRVAEKPMQNISVNDIAFFSALSLMDRKKYHGQKISLAGDLVTRTNFEKEWKEQGLPEHFLTDVPVEDVKAAIAGHPLEGLIKFFNEEMHGELVDVVELRKVRPELATLSSFLKDNKAYIQSAST